MQQELADLLDREKIRACLAILARGEDRRDADLIRSACWPESVSDYGVFSGNFEEYLAWVVPGSDAIINTQHILGQSHIVLDASTASAETQLISYHRIAGEAGQDKDVCIGGRYLDKLEKRDGEWRIASRTMLYDWVQDWGVSANWAEGVMGMPFGDERYIGSSRDDFSRSFLGEAR